VPASAARAAMVAALGLLAAAGPAGAQVLAPPPAAAPPVAQGQEAAGIVARVDRAGRTVTLDTGVDYILPPALDSAWPNLREGAAVTLRYDVDGGRNVVSRIQLGAP
jgi:Protein of unknown function (DUF1344)